MTARSETKRYPGRPWIFEVRDAIYNDIDEAVGASTSDRGWWTRSTFADPARAALSMWDWAAASSARMVGRIRHRFTGEVWASQCTRAAVQAGHRPADIRAASERAG